MPPTPIIAEIVDPRLRRRAAEVEASLRTFEGEPPNLESLAPRLVELLGCRRGGAYGYRADEGGIRIAYLNVVGFCGPEYQRDLDAAFSRDPHGTVAYDPLRPEPTQRNRVVELRTERIDRLAENRSGMASLRRRHRWLAEHQLRVLVCEGASVLAWVGVLRETPFRAREKTLLRALVPALRRRLSLERQLSSMPLAFGTLAAAIEAIGTAALLVRAPSAVVHANAAGRALLEASPVAGLDAIRAAGPTAFTWTSLALPGLPPHWLVVRARPPEDPAPRLAAVARRADLTPRQREVLGRVVVGEANKTIAFALGISENAVERHVTALLHRLASASRSELVARFWSGAP
jgi:DNA-binding CsgD family transcriptional regulator